MRRNILILMVDQLAGTLFPDGPAEFLHAPNLKALAERSVRFAANYCASPLCAPSRAAFMSGQLPSRTGVYDNAAEFASAVPTFAHHLRRLGYATTLSGKMHFVGPDQLHGFEERLTTDVYPPDFGWTPDWTRPGERIDWWYHNLGSVTGAGIAEITNQLEYDDEVAFHAIQRIYDFARADDRRPFALTVSFTHPHDPYVMRRRYWDLYDHDALPMPTVAPIPYDKQDPHSQRLLDASDRTRFDIREEHIRSARHGYFAAISYLDEKIGEILEVLRLCRLAEDTIIVFCSDHGDMLGERGLWFKMSFYEGSARVPLMIAGLDLAARRIDQPVSLLDLLPTLVELAGGDPGELDGTLDGKSLVPLAQGIGGRGPVLAEYAAEGAVAPMVMVRDERYKLVRCPADPDQLFDLAADPLELKNVAGEPGSAEAHATLGGIADERWDLAAYNAAVIESQARRHLVYEALRNGAYYPWDFQPLRLASERYMRNHMDLNELEAKARFPRE